MQKIFHYLKLIRVSSWIKNGLIFIPLLFSGNLLNPELFTQVFVGFIAFSLIASGVYVMNDLFDRHRDAGHPTKKYRPLASGLISSTKAWWLLIILELIGFSIAALLGLLPFILCLIYFAINLLYNFHTKHVFLADIISIVLCYLLRIGIGGVIIQVPLSHWLIIVTILVALMVILAKRLSELRTQGSNHRKVLAAYSINHLTRALITTGALTTIVYSLYTTERFQGVFLLSAVFVAGFIWRYIFLVIKRNFGEHPERFVTDRLLTVLFLLYTITIFIYLYGIH